MALSSSTLPDFIAAMRLAHGYFCDWDDFGALACARYLLRAAVNHMAEVGESAETLAVVSDALRTVAWSLQECAEFELLPGDSETILAVWECQLWVDLRRCERHLDLITDSLLAQAHCMGCLGEYEKARELYCAAAQVQRSCGALEGELAVYAEYTKAVVAWPKRDDDRALCEEIVTFFRGVLWAKRS